MKKSILIVFLCFSYSISAQGSLTLTLEKLKEGLTAFLVEKKQIITRANSKSFGKINLYGLHNTHVNTIPKNGVYGFNNGSVNKLSFFVIVDNNKYQILDLSTLGGFKDATSKILNFSSKKNYCKEIVTDYMSRLLNVYYKVNRNPRNYKTNNCVWPNKSAKSIYTTQALRLKLAEYLVKQKEIISIDSYFDNNALLFLDRIDMYHGMPKANKNVECGIYMFTNYDNPKPVIRYVIVNEDWFEILELKEDQLKQNILDIIDFGERQNTCYLKTKERIELLIETVNNKSCFDSFLKELP